MAVAHVTHAVLHRRTRQLTRRRDATDEEIMEAIWVAAEIWADGAYAHSAVALHSVVGSHQHNSR